MATMLRHVKERTGRLGDALLARLVPRMDAEAVCGYAVKCCAYPNGESWLGYYRKDPEHGGACTDCIANFRNCS